MFFMREYSHGDAQLEASQHIPVKMDALERQTIHKRDERIEQYIQDTARADGDINSLFTGVRQLFLHTLLLFKHSEDEFKAKVQYSSLSRSYSRLVLWYNTYQSLCNTRQGDLPLDLIDTTTRYLKDITKTLVDRLLHLASKESSAIVVEGLDCYVQDVMSLIQKVKADGDNDSDDSSSYDYDSYTEVAEDLKTDTTCLSGLNLLISRSSIEPSITEAVTGAIEKQWELYRPYCDRISNRFPDGTECLISRLGKANYDRYIRWTQRNNEIGDESDEPEESNQTGQLQKAHTVMVSTFHDSGLGSSVPSKSSYAETVMSYGADGNGQSVRIPPLSEEAKKGRPFTCVACSKTVNITNNSLWKRHLYEDLCPWMCLDPECPSGHSVFSQRNDWLTHLSFEHQMAPAWASFQCPLCRKEIESGKASITRHLGSHLEEIALGSLPISTEWDKEDDQNSQISVSGGSDFASPKLFPSPSPPPKIPLPKIQTLDNKNADDQRKKIPHPQNRTAESSSIKAKASGDTMETKAQKTAAPKPSEPAVPEKRKNASDDDEDSNDSNLVHTAAFDRDWLHVGSRDSELYSNGDPVLPHNLGGSQQLKSDPFLSDAANDAASYWSMEGHPDKILSEHSIDPRNLTRDSTCVNEETQPSFPSRSVFPCEKGCDYIASSKKDRDRHHSSQKHRPDLYGKSSEIQNTFQCACGVSMPRRDNHLRHVNRCKAPAKVPYQCDRGHIHETREEYMRHLRDQDSECGKRRGRTSQRPSQSVQSEAEGASSHQL